MPVGTVECVKESIRLEHRREIDRLQKEYQTEMEVLQDHYQVKLSSQAEQRANEMLTLRSRLENILEEQVRLSVCAILQLETSCIVPF